MAKTITSASQLFLLKTFKVYHSELPVVNTISVGKGVVVIGECPTDVRSQAENLYGYDFEKMNASFYKSWKSVLEVDPVKHIMNQMLHYIGTYGFESLGMEPICIVPDEVAEAMPSDIKPPVFTYIKPANADKLKRLILELAQSGIALSSYVVNGCVDIINGLEIRLSGDDIASVKNRELKSALYTIFGLTPKNGEEFIRYMYYTVTNKACLVKSHRELVPFVHTGTTTGTIDRCINSFITSHDYSERAAVIELAKSFNRYKKMWLLIHKYSSYENIKSFVNKISNASKTRHVPSTPSFLDTITSLYDAKFDDKLKNKIKEALDAVPTFRAIRVLNAMRYNLLSATNSADEQFRYIKVRNGREYVKPMIASKYATPTSIGIMQFIADYINNRVCANIQKYLDEKDVDVMALVDYDEDNNLIEKSSPNFNIACPTSEKDFIGEMPAGSSFSTNLGDKMLVCGVWWVDDQGHRNDLDLKVNSDTISIGWNSDLRNACYAFSGDMTSAPAPHGASEYIMINPSKFGKVPNAEKDILSLDLNNFTGMDCDWRFFFALEDANAIKSKSVINPTNVIYSFNGEFDGSQRQISLGSIEVNRTTSDVRLVLSNINGGDSAVSGRLNEHQVNSNKAKQTLSEAKFLISEIDMFKYIDLSLMNKALFIKLFA